ncbi:DUF5753 domain-containing protein [Actinoallomurus sp. NPDC052308]|uniref:DUF5753 domain-containing protein n=1 Tax=Actinoallomurus sp. NPDC052308 TaxID=3155530 RepID=UPI0034195CAA
MSRNNPPKLHIILDQGILERPIGHPKTMRGQLLRLVEASDAPHVGVQILPKDVGATSGLEGPFSILSLPEPIPDVGYTEGVGGAVYLESVEDVRRCTLRFGMLIDQALSPSKSVDLLASAAAQFG